MALISNIQKYSIHDGDGIRTTIFFKGCPLRCKWCHNPETWSFQKEVAHNFEQCNQCGLCVKACPKNCITLVDNKIVNDYTHCDFCGDCVDICMQNAREIFGRDFSIGDIVKEIEKDMIFYETSGGGVTLSGGELFAQESDFVKDLLEKLKTRGYHVLIDTSGYTDYKNIQTIIPLVDGFLYDIKTMDSDQHMTYTGVPNTLILDNLRKLSKDGGNIHIRIPIIGGVNGDIQSMEDIADFLENNHIVVQSVTLIPYHHTAESKYMWLGIESFLKDFSVPTPACMEALQGVFINRHFNLIE